jgi:hypothetical protein
MIVTFLQGKVRELTVEEREQSDTQFNELDQVYPHLVEVARTFISHMASAKYENPEINLIRLEAMLTGWIYAQTWFWHMSHQLPHSDSEIFEHVGDSVLQAATDASAGFAWFPQPEPEKPALVFAG